MAEDYSCMKCSNSTYTTDTIRTTGSGLTRFLNIQNRKFLIVTCEQCGFSEMYRQFPGGKMGTALDFIIG